MKKLLLIITALLFLAPATPALAAWKFIGGAELNSVTDGVEIDTNTAPFATSSTAHSGLYSWEVKNGAGFGRKVIYTSNQTSTSSLRVWVYPIAYPNASTRLIYEANATNVFQDNLTMSTTGTLVLLKASGAQIGSASAALPLNTWSCVEIMDEPTTGTTGTLTARLNGTTFATGANSAAGSWARVLWGNVTGTQTSNDMLFDDVAVTDATTGFVGCGSDVFLQPDAPGDSAAFTIAGTTPAPTNWQSVNEIPPDDAKTLVKANVLFNTDFYNFTDSGLHSYDTVHAIVTGVRYNNDTADATTAFQMQYESSSGATDIQGPAIVPNSTTWTSANGLSTIVDSSGNPLTNTSVDNQQVGYFISTAGVHNVQVTNTWEYVDYTAGTPPVVNTGPAICSLKSNTIIKGKLFIK